MKIRSGFVSNSSSASFVVDIPVSKKRVVRHLFENLFDEFFSKYALSNTIKDDLEYLERSLEKNIAEYKDFLYKKELNEINEEESGSFDEGTWRKGRVESIKKYILDKKEMLEQLNKLSDTSEMELVSFGLNCYHMYCSQIKDDSGKDICRLESSTVTMYNDYGDMPKKFRNIVGVLSFLYPDLKCWVNED